MPITSLANDNPPRFDLKAALARYREQVRPTLLAAVPEREPRSHLYGPIRAYLERPSKGLRPALCIATCRAYAGDAERALPSAAALELLHNAFLVHDDIEDESEYRRDQPALHREYGVPLAVNVGDAMNALALRLLRGNLPLLGPAASLRIVEEFDHLSIETLEGQAIELGWIRDNVCGTSEEDYLAMVLKKTCYYSFIEPCRIGAIAAGPAAGEPDRFDRFGYYLGVAFQIRDDVLNLVGDRRKYGKEIGGDLLEGKRTLILSHLWRHATAHERDRLRAFLEKPRKQRLPREVAWIYEQIERRGSTHYAEQVAREFLEAARREFAFAFEGALEGEDLDFLSGLLDYTIEREA